MAGPFPSSQIKIPGRLRLLEAANGLFGRHTLEEVSVAQILEFSGLKAPTLYHHFQDKEGLYETWATQTLDDLSSLLQDCGDQVELARALVQDSRVDLTLILRSLKQVRRPDSVQNIMRAYEFGVLRIIAGKLWPHLAERDLAGSLPLAAYFVHACMFLAPGSGYESWELTLEVVAKAGAMGDLQSTPALAPQ